jgi:hypothetical protein
LWTSILIVAAVAAVLCALSAALLRLQPMDSQPGMVNRFAGLTIGHGFRLTQRWRLTGDRQLLGATLVAWLVWAVIGGAIIALLAPGYDPGRMWIVYGLLCGAVGAIGGFFLAAFSALAYAKAINMSSFEGKSGYFVMLIGLLGGIVGALACGIAMALYFRSQGP